MRTFAFALAFGLAAPALAGGHGGFGGGGGCYGGQAFAAPVQSTYSVQTFAAPVMPAYSVQSFAAPVTSCNATFGAAGGCGGGGGFSTFGAGIGYGAAPVVTATPVLVARRPGLLRRLRAGRRGFRAGFRAGF